MACISITLKLCSLIVEAHDDGVEFFAGKESGNQGLSIRRKRY